jgi:hypothetical protein
MPHTVCVGRLRSRMPTERRLLAVVWVCIGLGMIFIWHNTSGYILGACWLVGGIGYVVRSRVPNSDE